MASAMPHDAARMAWWLSAWLRGDAGPDDVRDAVVGDDAAHDVVGLGPDGEVLPLVLALGRLRALRRQVGGAGPARPGAPGRARRPARVQHGRARGG